MKKELLALSVLFFSFTTITDNPVDRLGVKGPLEFNKTSFKLAWTDKPNDTYYIQEYLPDGETTEGYNQMLTIHLFDTDIKLRDAVKQKVKWLTERKKTDPNCNYTVTESPDGKEFMVDFLLGESKDDRMTIIEFNVYRYKQIELGHKRKAIVVYAYSRRAYGDKIIPFLNSLGVGRIDYLNQMIKTEIPPVTIESK